MIGWSGRRKALTVLLFISPTLLGIFVFSVYPILFNAYISLTNRNQFHPNPDCKVALTSIFEPTCWGVFRAPPEGLATPFHIQDPWYANYASLAGDLFTSAALVALVKVLITLIPLIAANLVNRRLDRGLTRPVSSLTVWLVGILAAAVVGFLVGFPAAWGTLMSSGDFFLVTLRTVLYVAICMPLILVTALALAVILNNQYLRGRTVFRVIAVVPWAASTVAIMMSLVFQFFFRDKGTINQVLRLVGIQGTAWLNGSNTAFAVIVLVQIWYTYPFFLIVMLGALQSIPSEQYEAAEMDGAGFWSQLINITLPLLRPAVLPAVVLSSITTFQLFETVWAITAGGPSAGAGVPGSTELVMVYAYKQVFQTQAYGRMGAFAVIMFIVLFLATLYSMRLTRITERSIRMIGRPSRSVRVLYYAILGVMTLVTLYPVWFVVLAAGRVGQRLYTLNLLGMFIPTEWSFENFRVMLFEQPFLNWVGNSLFIAGMTMTICMLVSTSAAFAFSRFKFRGRNSLLILFLAIQAFPGVLSLVPKAQILSAIGLYGNKWGLIMAYISGVLVFTTWNMKGYFDTIPIDLEEAGMIDGCGPIQSFLLIALPLARPALAVTALFAFMAGWGEYALASVLIPSPNEAKTLMVGMYGLVVTTISTPWGYFAAGAVMVMIPVLIVFLLLQRFLEGGLTLGGVKG